MPMALVLASVLSGGNIVAIFFRASDLLVTFVKARKK
jgi:hypothetical protein